MRASKQKSTSDAVEILHRRYYEGRPHRLAALDEARASAAVARSVYELRTKAGLSRTALARIVRTTEATIARIEDDDYQGHSIAVLRRIAAALDRDVEIRLVPRKRRRAA